ncbi:MAG: hypothetical protein OHK93_008296 [Ramalina farinacea]|uniref:CID domain-containing protein n=1 Tax=Ramalina farinacea TaxID=258253 RepID=A0AA43QP98_9LECA|nr:hypothetical protein [Ramalina farinacea]
MAYTDDGVRAKLSALNETQESIVTVAQWVMFHRYTAPFTRLFVHNLTFLSRRHADKTATLWLQRLKDSSSNKRLNLIYLANEVAQQSKARRKDDFLVAFAPIIAEATAIAYRGATNEVQQKLRRVVQVWRARQIFETPIQDAVEARIDDLDKSRSSSKKPALGGSLFSSSSTSAPPELHPLIPLQSALTKATAASTTCILTAESEYAKLSDPANPIPTPRLRRPPIRPTEEPRVRRICARRALVEGLENLLSTNKSAIEKEEVSWKEFGARKSAIEQKKREVEDGIMRGLSGGGDGTGAGMSPISPMRGGGGAGDPRMNGATAAAAASSPGAEPDRPDVEELTPPPEEAPAPTNTTTTAAAPSSFEPTPVSEQQPQDPRMRNQAPTPDLIHLHQQQTRSRSTLLPESPPRAPVLGIPPGAAPASKKRKMDDDEEAGAVFGSAAGEGGEGDVMAGLDDDVAELLRQESGSGR